MPHVFNATGTGATGSLQTYTVPDTGDYLIKAAGAEGGFLSGNNNPNGQGARISGVFALEAGDVLRILVGQEGLTGGTAGGQGGGGGTFVVKEVASSDYQMPDGTYVEPLIVAGGGAGSPDSGSNYHLQGRADNRGTGGGTSSSQAGGGGGFEGDGANAGSPGGYAFLNGGTGGSEGEWAEGGFGGGGGKAGSNNASGGGGGYDGGDYSYDDPDAGGGSFNAGTNQENLPGDSEAGNFGHGWVEIESLSVPPEEISDGPSLTGLAFDRFSVQWSAPSGVTSSDGYTVTVSAGGTEIASKDHTDLADLAATFDGLDPETDHTLEITPYNQFGDGPTTSKTITTLADEPPGEAPEVGFDVHLQTITAEWPWVLNATGYVARIRTPSGALVAEKQADDQHVEFDDLQRDARHVLAVAATNSNGEGPESADEFWTDWQHDGRRVRLQIEPVWGTDAIIQPDTDPDQGLAGTVIDVTGQPLEGRLVHVYNRATGDRVATVQTDGEGAWQWSGADVNAEYFVVAINPAPDAEDYAPSAANRLSAVEVANG